MFPDEAEEVILAHAESLYQDTQWDDCAHRSSLVNVAPWDVSWRSVARGFEIIREGAGGGTS